MAHARVLRRAVLALSLPILLVACAGGRFAVDEGTAARYAGSDYLGIDGSRFAIDPAGLAPAGQVDDTNLQDTDRTAYALPGVEPTAVFVLRRADGAFVVFAPRRVFAPGQPPLGVVMPELCAFLANPAADGCP